MRRWSCDSSTWASLDVTCTHEQWRREYRTALFSPDGKRLAFVSTIFEQRWHIFVDRFE